MAPRNPPRKPQKSPHKSRSPRPTAAAPAPPPRELGTPDASWTVPAELGGRPLDNVVRTLADVSWSDARKWIETGKIAVDGHVTTETTRRTRASAVVTRHPRAPSPKAARLAEYSEDLIAYVDPAVVVVRKPAGISTIPFGDE